MVPIIKKTGTSPAGKSGSRSLISKTPAEKSGSIIKFGRKQNNSRSLAGVSSSASLGAKYPSSPSFGGKSGNTTASTSKIVTKNSNSSNFSNNTNFGNKISDAQGYNGKGRTATNLGEPGTSFKSSKPSSDPLKTIIPKSYGAPNMTPKNKKSSLTFGIIWLPTKKRNKMKHSVYNPYDTDRRDAFKERTPSMYNFMSGDTSDHQTFKKKEETDLLESDRTKLPPAPIDGSSSDIEKTGNAEEKQEFLKQSIEESRDAAGDSYEKDDGNNYLENKESLNKAPDATWQKDKGGDKVDSVCLHPRSPHKSRSTQSTVEEEDCGIKCLYYTLQCCDCVLM